MMKYLLTALFCFFLASCATILNSDKTTVFVYTEEPATVIHNLDTIKTENINGFNAARLHVPRSKYPLRLKFESDSIKKRIDLPTETSKTYHLNYIYIPLILADIGSTLKYTYKSPVILDRNLEIKSKKVSNSMQRDINQRNQKALKSDSDRFDTHQGNWYLNLSVPFVYPTFSVYAPENASRFSQDAFFGFGAGLDYYYKKNRFVNLSASFTSGGDIGCGDNDYDEEDAYSFNVHVSNNHRFKRFSFGYGLSYSYSYWHKNELLWQGQSYETPIKKHQCWRYSGLGAVFNTYFYFSPNFYAGIIYKPTFVRLKARSGSPFFYEHQVSLDFAFKIKLFKGK